MSEITDIEITRDAELMISQIQGVSDVGIDFVDAYIPERVGAEYTVLDSGRILLAEQDMGELLTQCRKLDLVVTITDV